MTRPAPLALRARDFTLAALATGYPCADALEALGQLRRELSDHAGLGAWLRAADGGLEVLRARYAECFDVGAMRTPLYESDYGRGRGLAKGRTLADAAGFYRAFGFSLAEGCGGEMPDHVAVELEFYALLLHKQDLLSADAEGSDIVERARRSFLADHLGAFVPAIARQPAVAAHEVFGPLLGWCADLVAAECALLGATPAPLELAIGAPDADDEVRCDTAGSTARAPRSHRPA